MTTCLFSRARPGKPVSKKVHGFLALPGEVRNQIYGYYFQSDFRCEFAAEGYNFEAGKPVTFKLLPCVENSKTSLPSSSSNKENDESAVIRISRPLGRYSHVKGLQTDWRTSLFALHLVCKQIHAETIAFVYRRTVFVFSAPRRISTFLSITSKVNLERVTQLQLHYDTYGAPKYCTDCCWQERHLQSWTRVCKAASKTLRDLRKLDITVRVNCSPLLFNLREPWVAPLHSIPSTGTDIAFGRRQEHQ